MPAERAPMRKIREVLRLKHALGLSERQIAVVGGREPVDGCRVSAACRRGRHHLAGAGGDGRRRAGAAAVHAAVVRGEAGTGRCPIGTTSTRS